MSLALAEGGPITTVRRQRVRLAPFLVAVSALVCALAIVRAPFPQSLAVVLGVPLLALIWRDLRAGIALWFVLAALGNMVEVDLPGVPPLRTAHLVLLALWAIWTVKGYRQIPAAVGSFLRTGTNRVLLLLLGWITLSMIMARLEGVTQKSVEYQFNAWMSIVLAISLAVLVSWHADEKLVRMIVWATVLLGTALTAVVLAAGVLNGVGLWDWKNHYYTFITQTGLVYVDPLFMALVFFSGQKGWGKALFATAIALSGCLHVLMAMGGSRTDLLPLVTLAFLLAFTRPRLLIVLVVAALGVIVVKAPSVQEWLLEQVDYTTEDGVTVGKGNRLAIAQDAIRIVQQHPLWGTGSDFYRWYADVRVVYLKGGAYPTPTAHDTWLQTAVDHGAPAAVLLALFLAGALKNAFALYTKAHHPALKGYALLFLCTLCTTLVGSPFADSVLPVFTGTTGAEAVQLARYLISFWVAYGLVSGIATSRIVTTEPVREAMP